jgi:hypothetical protein
MSIDTTGPRTRRAILLGAAGAVAATTVGAVTRSAPATATVGPGDNGKVIHVGDIWDDVRTYTYLENKSNNVTVFAVRAGGGDGVSAHSNSGTGVEASSTSGTGVWATSYSGAAVHGASTSGIAIAASSTSGVGVDATSKSSIGVRGQSDSDSGVVGYSGATDFPAVFGSSGGGNTAVYGFTGPFIPEPSPKNTGVYGLADLAGGGTGVFGRAPGGRGVVASGGKAQLRLVPSAAATHPPSGATGDLFVDKASRLWFCIKGGPSATWKRVSLV